MAAKTKRIDSEDEPDPIDALNQIRLVRNWSYQQLADDMARAGFPVRAKTLQNIISYRPTPWDRTMYQIRQYLASLKDSVKTAKKVPA